MPLAETAGWVERFVVTYHSLKHANRELPDAVELLDAWREAVLVTRTWVALELGVDPEAVRER